MSDTFNSQALAGKSVFVAGGSSGINLGIAEHMAGLGAKIAILSRNPEKIDAAVSRLKDQGADAIGLPADVRDYDAVEEALFETRERHGEIDCVISGAAGNFLAPAIGLSSNGFKTVIDIDLVGTFNVFRASWQYIRKPGASLIAITAPQAVQPTSMQVHACAAKAGINMLCKCLAKEWGPAGVRVNGISPGPIADTEGMARLAPTPEHVEKYNAELALGRFGTKTDVAEMATFLASHASSYVTGTILTVDGGTELGDASLDCISGHEARATQ